MRAALTAPTDLQVPEPLGGIVVAALTVNARSVDGPGNEFKASRISRRDLGPEDVLIDIAYSGICHSDLSYSKNEWGNTQESGRSGRLPAAFPKPADEAEGDQEPELPQRDDLLQEQQPDPPSLREQAVPAGVDICICAVGAEPERQCDRRLDRAGGGDAGP